MRRRRAQNKQTKPWIAFELVKASYVRQARAIAEDRALTNVGKRAAYREFRKRRQAAFDALRQQLRNQIPPEDKRSSVPELACLCAVAGGARRRRSDRLFFSAGARVDPEGKGLIDHWAKTAHAFLTGAVLHVLYAKKAEGKTGGLPDIALALSDPSREIDALYHDMLANTHCNGKPHPVVAAAARDMLNRPDEERGSVLSTAISFLSLYRDPLIAKNVGASDFKMADLMNHEKPVTLYLVVRAEDKDRMRPLMRLIINQLVRVLLRPEITYQEGRPVRPHRHRLLLMLDEFPSYGKLEVFQEALAYIAGYGIKAYLIAQDIAQLWGAYGRDESIVSNCHIRIAYAPNKIETAEWLSRMAGTATIVKEDITQSGGRFAAILKNVSKTYHQVGRPLATADEIMRLKAPAKDKGDIITEPGDMLVFVAGHAPIFGTQSLYFRDPVFLARANLPAPQGNSPIGAAAIPPFRL